MKQDLATGDIRAKFQMLISMDETVRQRMQREKSITHQQDYIYNKLKQKPTLKQLETTLSNKQIVTSNKQIDTTVSNNTISKPQQQNNNINNNIQNQNQLQTRFKQVIYTKGDIVKQISKLKPYLNPDKQQLTTVEIQNMENKKMSSQEKKNLSNVIIYLNKRLCEKLRQQNSIQEELGEERVRLDKEGWIYEVFYRRSENNKAQLANTQFKAGYAIMTTVLQLYENLTFTRKLVKLNVSQIKRVKYTSQKQYQIIDIRYDGGTLQIAFLNQQKLELFDRMLFLLKNMARTSTNRLFQNQLIKSLYAEY